MATPVAAPATCTTLVGDTAAAFGIPTDVASLLTTSVQVAEKREKKEAKDRCGDVITVAYYGSSREITVEGLGLPDAAIKPAEALTMALTEYNLGGLTAITNVIVIDEVTVDQANEDFAKTTIKATQYSGIDTLTSATA